MLFLYTLFVILLMQFSLDMIIESKSMKIIKKVAEDFSTTKSIVNQYILSDK